ncbi:MAG: WecB/TagA/CpsF family glycosyltransferase [Lachnospiraceae bacterium]|nr:WecB/TagA/CpsF family glycosyltransferase [Lachnospiraceae bacterium]
MIKKINILGMQVDNYTVRESMLQLESYMNSTVLNVIETISMKQLMLATENPVIAECVEKCDLSIIGEKEILAESGQVSVQRLREIKDKDFMHELIKRIVRNQRRVYLIAETRADIETMQNFFLEVNPKFSVTDSYALEECAGDADDIVNEINSEMPDIVISALPSPVEEGFVLAHKDKIGAHIWYGLGTDYNKKSGIGHVGNVVKNLTLRGRLRHTMQKFEKENKDRK